MALMSYVTTLADKSLQLNVDYSGFVDGCPVPNQPGAALPRTYGTLTKNLHLQKLRIKTVSAPYTRIDHHALSSIASRCTNLRRILIPKSSLQISLLNFLRVEQLSLVVGSIIMTDCPTVESTRRSVNRLHELHALYLMDPMNSVKLNELFVVSIPGLIQLSIEGSMNNADVARLKRNATIRCLTINTHSFNVCHLGHWRSLTTVNIQNGVGLESDDSEVVRGLPHLTSLNVIGAAYVNVSVFRFLSELTHLVTLSIVYAEIYYRPFIDGSGLSYRLESLDLSYTSALVDDLLSFLQRNQICLRTLRADNHVQPGFTTEALSSYLHWDRNCRLVELSLRGHWQLTRHIFSRSIASITSLKTISLANCGNDIAHGVRDLVNHILASTRNRTVALTIHLGPENPIDTALSELLRNANIIWS
jgi:hypothetical protein